jgi:hypothetical protein
MQLFGLKRFEMKTIAIIITTLFLATGVLAQDPANKEAANNLTKKELRKAKLEADFQRTSALISSRQFVVEADWLGNSSGTRVSVSSNLNFISVDSSNAIIQTGSNSLFGRNGFGGVTAEGTITGWKEYTNAKSKSSSIRMDVSSRRGLFTIFIDISASGKATATLSGQTAGRLIYYGRLVPLNESNAYSGFSM